MLFVKILTCVYLVHKCTSAQNLLSKFNQHEYKIRDFRVELTNWNKELVNSATLYTFKYNRSVAAVNASFNLKIDAQYNTFGYVVQCYKLASNEYRVFPIRFQVNLNDALKENVGGVTTTLGNCGNFDVYGSLFDKDVTYYICNFVLDERKLPPLIPTGLYKIETTVLYEKNIFAKANIFIEMYIPVKYPTH